MILCEFRQVLVNVEYDRYRDDKENGIDISTYKLLYDVPIEALDVSENVEIAQKRKFASYPCHATSEPLRMAR